MLIGFSRGAARSPRRLILSSEFHATLRRLKPEKRHRSLIRRPEAELPFLDNGSHPGRLLYDTTVYIDILQNRFPRDGGLMLRAADAWHSPVTELELAVSCGLLDPMHPRTPEIMAQIVEIIERRPAHRTIVPDSEIWREAGILSGTLARVQEVAKDRRRRILNGALFIRQRAKIWLRGADPQCGRF